MTRDPDGEYENNRFRLETDEMTCVVKWDRFEMNDGRKLLNAIYDKFDDLEDLVCRFADEDNKKIARAHMDEIRSQITTEVLAKETDDLLVAEREYDQ